MLRPLPVILFLFVAAPAVAAAGLRPDMDLAAVHAASLEAMGGAEAVAEIHSIKADATCTAAQGEFRTHTQSARGDMFFFQQRSPSGAAFQAYLVPGSSLFVDSRDGTPTPLQPQAVAGLRAHDFQMFALEFGDRFPEATTAGEAEFLGGRCLAVDYEDEMGSPARAYYHMDSALLAGFEMADPVQPRAVVRVRYLDWMDVDGVRFPSLVLMSDSTGETVFRFLEISTNGVPEDAFRPDTGQ